MPKEKNLKTKIMYNYKIFIPLSFIILISCAQSPKEEIVSKNSDSSSRYVTNQSKDSLGQTTDGTKQLAYKKDTISKDETKILSLIANENEFVLVSKEIERFYETSTGDLLFSRLFFSKSDLEKAGYISFELTIQGDVSNRINLNYNYNMGQTSYGFGYVVGDGTDNYMHSLKSCGITSCIIQVFDTGKKVLEKEKLN